MKQSELTLLLTTARILRAKIANEIYAEQRDDMEAMNEALAPFDPSPVLDELSARVAELEATRTEPRGCPVPGACQCTATTTEEK